jgi:hypothetical protein
MVSLNTLFTLGILGAGLLAFTSLGGAGGIGQRIGGGFKAFQDNLLSGFTGALNPFGAAATSGEPLINLQLSNDPLRYTDPGTVAQNLQNAIDMNTGQPIGTSPQLPDEFNQDTEGGQVDTSPAPQATPISTSFQPQVISGVISPEFAAKYSFVPPKQGALDVSKAFEFINVGSTYNKPNREARKASDYGGYGSEQTQNDTLAGLIETNAAKYSEYFS